MPLDNLTETQARHIDDHYPVFYRARLAEKTRLAIDAINAQAAANAAAVLAAQTAQAAAELAEAHAETAEANAVAAANADRVGVMMLRVPVTAGKVTQAYLRWPFAGAVLRVDVAASELITSAADGVTSAILHRVNEGVVPSFDLEALPSVTGSFEPCVAGTGAPLAFVAGDPLRAIVYAGADALGGQDLTYAVTYERAALA